MTEEYADVGATQLQLAMKSVSMGNKVALTSLRPVIARQDSKVVANFTSSETPRENSHFWRKVPNIAYYPCQNKT